MNNKPIITILVPLCSRKMNFIDFKMIPLCKSFVPNIKKTIEPTLYEYRMYFGIDDDDEFFMNHQEELKGLFDNVKVVILKQCQHRPVRAWNVLFERAYYDGSDYFFQIGDDVSMESTRWSTVFIDMLKRQNNIGTVGPCESVNYEMRKKSNLNMVIENNFVHRTHYDIFQYFFYPEIKNWFCDDWITAVYDEKARMCIHIMCKNTIRDSRYSIQQCTNLMRYIIEGKQKISKYLRKKSNINITHFFTKT